MYIKSEKFTESEQSFTWLGTDDRRGGSIGGGGAPGMRPF